CARLPNSSACDGTSIGTCTRIHARKGGPAAVGASLPFRLPGVLPPNDPNEGYRSDLPKLPRDARPVGYRPGRQIEERLQGLGAILLGVVGLAVVYGISTGVLPSGLPPPPQPSGVLVQVPVINSA